MNCEEATKLMDGYLDGELDYQPNERAGLAGLPLLGARLTDFQAEVRRTNVAPLRVIQRF